MLLLLIGKMKQYMVFCMTTLTAHTKKYVPQHIVCHLNGSICIILYILVPLATHTSMFLDLGIRACTMHWQ